MFASACQTPQKALAVPPGRTAPLADRQAYIQAHLPVADPGDGLHLERRQDGTPMVVRSGVTLHNGTRVHDVAALRPLVAPGSATAMHIDAEAEARAQGRYLFAGAAAAGIVGTGLAMGLVALQAGVVPDAGSIAKEGEVPWLVVGAASAAVVGLLSAGGLAFWGSTRNNAARLEVNEAFSAYPSDLAAALDVPASPPP